MRQSIEKKLKVLPGSRWTGIAQLSLVEHALSPLRPTGDGFVHLSNYHFSKNRQRQEATARVTCPLGFHPKKDELVLWGSLAMAASGEPNLNLYTSGRQLARTLGLSTSGQNLVDLRQSIYRLGQVSYFNDAFYDPIRKEHRAVGFGLLSHDLPVAEDSYRPWRISFDPVFFDFCRAESGYLGFDLKLYQSLSPSARRLFHKLKKILYRRPISQAFDVRELAINVLGCSPEREQKKFNDIVRRAARELTSREVLETFTMEKVGKGAYAVRFQRGPHFDKKPVENKQSQAVQTHPLYDSLTRLGLSSGHIAKIVKQYSMALVQQWTDVTLCRMEAGHSFKRSPAAFFQHYLRLAAEGKATPPDWYIDRRRREQNQSEVAMAKQLPVMRQTSEAVCSDSFETFMAGEREYYERIVGSLKEALVGEGTAKHAAGKQACEQARLHMQKRFLSAHRNQSRQGQPVRAGQLIDLSVAKTSNP